jgi:predicted amidohydrolase
MEPLTVAAVQIAPRPGPPTAATVRANLDHAVEQLHACVTATGATLVVFPESATTGYTTGLARDELWELVSEIPGPVTDPIAAAAADLGVTVVWGTYERGAGPDLLFNSAATIGPDGRVLGVYRKTHLYVLEDERRGGWVTPGDDVSVVDTPAGRVGTTICFDGDFPELSRINAALGAEILVRPSALLRSADIWELTTRARAYDNHCYVVAANAVGQDPAGTVYFGNSLIVGPTAAVLARATAQEGWISADLDPDPLRSISPGSSVPQVFDHLADRNLTLYARYADRLGAAASAPFPHAAMEEGRR